MSTTEPSVSSDAESRTSQRINVLTKDNKTFQVSAELLKQSRVFRDIYENGLAEFDQGKTFEVKTIDGDTFEKVIQWCKEHQGVPEPTIEVDPHTRERKWFSMTEFERRFFDLPIEQLEPINLAASYLDIPSLYLYSCQAIAALIKGRSPEEIRALLGLPDDLTDEEKQAIRCENIWLSE